MSSFDGTHGQAFDKVALKERISKYDWSYPDHCHRHAHRFRREIKDRSARLRLRGCIGVRGKKLDIERDEDQAQYPVIPVIQRLHIYQVERNQPAVKQHGKKHEQGKEIAVRKIRPRDRIGIERHHDYANNGSYYRNENRYPV